MKKIKHRFNKKARLPPGSVERAENKVKLVGFDEEGYDEANCFILTDVKKRQKVHAEEAKKPLSNRQRKKLEKILARKSRKIDRKVVLEKLKIHKIAPKDREAFVPVCKVGEFVKSQKQKSRKRPLPACQVDEDAPKTLKLSDDAVEEQTNHSEQTCELTPNEDTERCSDECRTLDTVQNDEKIAEPSDRSSLNQKADERPQEMKFCSGTNEPESCCLPRTDDEVFCDRWTCGYFEVTNLSEKDCIREEQPAEDCAEAIRGSPAEAFEESGGEKNEGVNSVTHIPAEKKKYILVDRSAEIQEFRSKLPIINEEHTIMEAVLNNDTVIVCGQTGSGKTTQVPQFLYEYGFTLSGKKIAVTEPRRAAARQMSFKVSQELFLSQEQVSYQTRFGGNVTDQTIIKFMTDGILLRELRRDLLLSEYSAVILDEAHERTLFSDILVGLLTQVVARRKKSSHGPLKLIIMSATLEYDNFTKNERLFPDQTPPIINVDTRQYPVEVRFLRSTPEDYIEACFEVVSRVHCSEPDGGILVFVTGKLEVNHLCSRLRRAFPKLKKARSQAKSDCKQDTTPETNSVPSNLESFPIVPTEFPNDFDKEDELSKWRSVEDQPLHVLPLHATLKDYEQQRVFQPVPEGCRLCVVSTNVAEVSLTIPNIKYVVDTGKEKVRVYDRLGGSSMFRVQWISKASAEQRCGRAGRTCSGICFRLYSGPVYNEQFIEHPKPEIERLPLEEVIMQMKSMGLDVNVHSFPYPTPPPEESLKAAEHVLFMLNLVELNEKSQKAGFVSGPLTKMGVLVSHYPLNPRLGKLLVVAKHLGVYEYALLLASVLTTNDYFLQGHIKVESQEGVISKPLHELRSQWSAKSRQHHRLGDFMLAMVAQESYERITEGAQRAKFCDSYGIRQSAAEDAKKLRRQLKLLSQKLYKEAAFDSDDSLPMITDEKAEDLRKSLLCGFADKLARKSDEPAIVDGKPVKHSYKLIQNERPAWIHSASSMFETLPDFVIFQDLIDHDGRLYMHGVCAVEPQWIPIFLERLCKFDEPTDASYDSTSGMVTCRRNAYFGPERWRIDNCQTPYPHDDHQIYKHFAAFILEGQVCPKLAEFNSQLVTPACTVARAYSRLHPRVLSLLGALQSQRVWNRQLLLDKWAHDKNFLLSEYVQFLPKAMWDRAASCWPPE